MSTETRVISTSRDGTRAQIVRITTDPAGVRHSTTHHVAVRNGAFEVIKPNAEGHETVVEVIES